MKLNALQISELYKYFSQEFKVRWRYILRKQRLDMEKETAGLKDQIYNLESRVKYFETENKDLKLVIGMMMSDEDAKLFIEGKQVQFIPSKRFPNTPQFTGEIISIASRRIEQAKSEGFI